MTSRYALILVAALAATGLGAGCSSGGGSGGGGGTGTINVEATDAFLPVGNVVEAKIQVSDVSVQVQGGAGSGFASVFSGSIIELDLLQLRNGVTQALGSALIPAGRVRQVRLTYADALLRLDNGNVYTTQQGNLTLTNQAASGQIVFIDPAVDVPVGGVGNLLLDFDLTKTFQPIPNNDPLNAPRYSLGPVIRGVNRGVTGDLSGTVTEAIDGSGVPNATIFVLPVGEQDLNNAITTTATDADGSYMVLGLAPDTYDVLVDDGNGRQDRSNDVQITSGAVTTVDFVLP